MNSEYLRNDPCNIIVHKSDFIYRTSPRPHDSTNGQMEKQVTHFQRNLLEFIYTSVQYKPCRGTATRLSSSPDVNLHWTVAIGEVFTKEDQAVLSRNDSRGSSLKSRTYQKVPVYRRCIISASRIPGNKEASLSLSITES